jgi:hypothetical protein
MLWLLKTRHGKALLSCLKSFSCIPGRLQSPDFMGATHVCAMGVSKEQKSWEDQDLKKSDPEEEDREHDAWLTMSAKMVSEGKRGAKPTPKPRV